MEYIVSRWMNIKLCVFLTVNNKEFVQKTNSSQYASTLTVQLFLRKKSMEAERRMKLKDKQHQSPYL